MVGDAGLADLWHSFPFGSSHRPPGTGGPRRFDGIVLQAGDHLLGVLLGPEDRVEDVLDPPVPVRWRDEGLRGRLAALATPGVDMAVRVLDTRRKSNTAARALAVTV